MNDIAQRVPGGTSILYKWLGEKKLSQTTVLIYTGAQKSPSVYGKCKDRGILCRRAAGGHSRDACHAYQLQQGLTEHGVVVSPFSSKKVPKLRHCSTCGVFALLYPPQSVFANATDVVTHREGVLDLVRSMIVVQSSRDAICDSTTRQLGRLNSVRIGGESKAVALFVLGACCLQLDRPSEFRRSSGFVEFVFRHLLFRTHSANGELIG